MRTTSEMERQRESRFTVRDSNTVSLPNDGYAERAVLAAILQNDANWDSIAGDVGVTDFFDDNNRSIFQAMAVLANNGEQINFQSVSSQLNTVGALREEANVLHLQDVYEYPVAGDIRRHALVIRQQAMLRELINATELIARTAYQAESRDVEAILSQAEDTIAKISGDTSANIENASLGTRLTDVEDRLEQIRVDGSAVQGVMTGLDELDEITNGFHKEDLVVLAARPGIGKTSFALNIAEKLLSDGSRTGSIAFFTLEQSALEIALKLVASMSSVSLETLRTQRLNQAESDRVESTLRILKEDRATAARRLIIDDSVNISVAQIRSRAKNIARNIAPIDLLIVDYIQLMDSSDGDDRADTRALQVAHITRGLKKLARELKVPVLAVSQLNRNPAQRLITRPQLSDLRDSGAIEQDADLVILIHRPDASDPGADHESDPEAAKWRGRAQLIVAKHRHGRTGATLVSFVGATTKFANASFDEYDDDTRPDL